MKKKTIFTNKIVLFILIFLLIISIIVLINYNKELKLNKAKLSEVESEFNIQQGKVDELKNELLEFTDKGIIRNEEKGYTYLSNVPAIDQFPDFPTGCESIALLILLKSYGVEVDASDIIMLLPREERPYYKNGVRYGGNPERGFLGDPTKYYGYGVYEKPIIEVANQFKPGIINATGKSLDDILKIIDTGNPVQVWVSMNLKKTSYSAYWIDEETGQTINWPSDFHSLVIVGYSNERVIVSDPDTGTIRIFDKATFEKVYNFFGKRAIYYEN